MELSLGSAGAGRPNRRGAAGSLQPTRWQVPVRGEATGRALALAFPAFPAVSFLLLAWGGYGRGDLSGLG